MMTTGLQYLPPYLPLTSMPSAPPPPMLTTSLRYLPLFPLPATAPPLTQHFPPSSLPQPRSQTAMEQLQLHQAMTSILSPLGLASLWSPPAMWQSPT